MGGEAPAGVPAPFARRRDWQRERDTAAAFNMTRVGDQLALYGWIIQCLFGFVFWQSLARVGDRVDQRFFRLVTWAVGLLLVDIVMTTMSVVSRLVLGGPQTRLEFLLPLGAIGAASVAACGVLLTRGVAALAVPDEGLTAPTRDDWRPALRWAVIAAVAYLVVSAINIAWFGGVKLTQSRRLLQVIAFGGPALAALRARRVRPESAPALTALAVGCGILAVRGAADFVVSGLGLQLTASPPIVVGWEVIVLIAPVIFGVEIFVAVMWEQRRQLLYQEEQVRVTEAGLWRAQRLETLGQMASSIAHDFNNLLTVIKAGSDGAFLAAESPEAVREDLAEVRDAVSRATGLTRQLLAFAAARTTAPRRFDPDAQIDELQAILRRLLGPQVRLEREASASSSVIEMDPSRFEQVVLNLVVNARDAMPAGGTVRIATSTGVKSLDERSVRCAQITVEDTGSGIPPDILERVFEPFFTTKAPDVGTGLGLATVRGIVRQDGGDVTVTSTVGRGTRFEVWFPAA